MIHFLRAALGFFDLYELAVHDGGAIGVDGEQEVIVLGIIVVAHSDGIHRVFVAVGGILLVEPLDAGKVGEHVCDLLIGRVVGREQLNVHLCGAGKVLNVLHPDTGLCAGLNAGCKVDPGRGKDEHQRQQDEQNDAEPGQNAFFLHKNYASFGSSAPIWPRCRWAKKKPTALAANTT